MWIQKNICQSRRFRTRHFQNDPAFSDFDSSQIHVYFMKYAQACKITGVGGLSFLPFSEIMSPLSYEHEVRINRSLSVVSKDRALVSFMCPLPKKCLLAISIIRTPKLHPFRGRRAKFPQLGHDRSSITNNRFLKTTIGDMNIIVIMNN